MLQRKSQSDKQANCAVPGRETHEGAMAGTVCTLVVRLAVVGAQMEKSNWCGIVNGSDSGCCSEVLSSTELVVFHWGSEDL